MKLAGAAAGWYEDPDGCGGQRYFDGRQWTDHLVPPKRRVKFVRKLGFAALAVLFGAAILTGIVAVVDAVNDPSTHGFSSSSMSASDDRMDVIRACQDSVRKLLKDPGSATFNSWTASMASGTPSGLVYDPSAGDLYYSASGMVNAKNGFGGYGGDEPYSCDAVVTTNTVRAQAHAG